MYTREEILSNYKKIDFPESKFDELVLNNKNILFYPESKPPSSSKNKDKSKLSQSYVIPWRILQQKNYYYNNNNNQNKLEFARSGNFTPIESKEPLINIKVENFKNIYDKFKVPLEKKIIYLKNHNNILGPFNYEELENMYKNKKYDSNYEFRAIDLFSFPEEDPFMFYPIKNVNEEDWAEEIIYSPMLEYSKLFRDAKELLDATKKRKTEIQELNDEINILKEENDKKDETINNLKNEIKLLNEELERQKELSETKNIKKSEKENKIEDKKTEKEKVEIIEIDKKVLYNKNDDEEDPKEIIEEEKIEIIQPKVLDMGGEWEIAGKKKKKVEKMKEEPKTIVGLSSKKGGIKNNADSLIKAPGSQKTKKNKISGDELVDMLKPKKKEEPKEEGELSTTEFKEVKGKGKKKNKKQFEHTDINFGFKY